jgi:DNA adenine methylase
VRRWFSQFDSISTLIEPFAGGAHVGLAAGIESWADRIVLVELDRKIAAFWRGATNNGKWLTERIRSFEMTHENVDDVLGRREESERMLAFSALLENRVSFNGIMHQTGRVSDPSKKWYPDTFAERIERIHRVGDRFEVIHGDGLEVMQKYVDREDVAFFVDPPYPDDRDRLYKHSDVDDDLVFQLCAEAGPRALLTYDTTDVVRDLVDEYGLESRKLVNENGRNNDAGELLISSDMGWL